MAEEKATGLRLLRAPFEPHQISKLPKPKSKDASKGWCDECHSYHGLPAVHLDYVGHAATTDRLLDADPMWSWEPMAYGPDGLPALDKQGGLWIRLTVNGVTRPGYGSAEGKTGGNAVKELIGDAIRNASMRFGVALELWHKGILHKIDLDQHGDDQPAHEAHKETAVPAPKKPITGQRWQDAIASIRSGDFTVERLHKSFELTTDQQTEVDDLVKEMASKP